MDTPCSGMKQLSLPKWLLVDLSLPPSGTMRASCLEGLIQMPFLESRVFLTNQQVLSGPNSQPMLMRVENVREVSWGKSLRFKPLFAVRIDKRGIRIYQRL